QLNGRTFQSNYDGSQDEGDEHNDSVLQKFFAPYTGDSSSGWPENQTRLIAVNEGRLVDFFLKHQNEFPLLEAQVEKGLKGAALKDGVAVINLNLRSVVAAPESGQPSILERLIARMTKQENWRACEQCDLKDKCYAYHNVRTFQDPIAGAKVVERLKTLYTITHLRGRLHITMRDIRSALAFMLAGTRDCDAIHELYASNNKREQNIILDGFYFNSWLGGSDDGEKSNDRLISLLKEIDIAEVSNPDLDRDLDFLNPKTRVMNRFTFAERATHDNELVEKLFSDLPRDYSVRTRYNLIKKHQDYLAHIRRRYFFERRDAAWKNMLPYTSIKSFQDAIEQTGTLSRDHTTTILHAINRGEGLSNPTRLGNQLALRVRQVNKGSIRSYRLFSGDHFTLRPELDQSAGSFLESLSQALVLHYDSGNGHTARLRINLDIYEMLMRLNNGYRPSVEEQEGFYLSLLVFKNVVSAAPYQEVLLTESGYDFYKVQRDPAGVLHMARVVEDTHVEDISEEVRA
ncbi:MAG: protein kinase, partial [Proteobacteria bacterium]|nr:protein kinase [Pseudomonadota bacterium]